MIEKKYFRQKELYIFLIPKKVFHFTFKIMYQHQKFYLKDAEPKFIDLNIKKASLRNFEGQPFYNGRCLLYLGQQKEFYPKRHKMF